MASQWNFVKKHRGKIVASGLLAGGLYAAHRYLEEHPETVDKIIGQINKLTSSENSGVGFDQPGATGEPGARSDGLQSQLNKHYVFDSHQRTCDTSIQQLIPSLQKRLQDKLNVEHIADRLKHGDYESDEEKLALWNEMKVASLTRLLAAGYGYSLLIAALKCQITILAADVFKRSQSRQQQRQLTRNKSSVFNFVTRWSAGDVNYEETSGSSQESDCNSQQLFLQCVQYFTGHGLDHLVDKIKETVTCLMGDTPLESDFTPEKLDHVLQEAKNHIEAGDYRNFSYFIVPITADQDAFAGHNERLATLLATLKHTLESEECRSLVSGFVDRFLTETDRFAKKFCPGLKENGGRGVPLAKLIPVLSDCFHTVSAQEFESVIQVIVSCEELHEFCKGIFEKGTEEE